MRLYLWSRSGRFHAEIIPIEREYTFNSLSEGHACMHASEYSIGYSTAGIADGAPMSSTRQQLARAGTSKHSGKNWTPAPGDSETRCRIKERG